MPRITAVLVAILMGAATVARSVEPPDDSPRWFKGNLHTHTLWSDGNDYPEMVVDYYARNGYQFLALSDHNVLSQGQRWMSREQANRRAGRGNDGFARYVARFGKEWVETRRNGNGVEEVRLKPLGEFRALFEKPGEFLMIQGEEITDGFERRPVHMNATNLLELIKPQGGKTIVETMANNLIAAEEQGRRLGRPILTHLNHPNFGYWSIATDFVGYYNPSVAPFARRDCHGGEG